MYLQLNRPLRLKRVGTLEHCVPAQVCKKSVLRPTCMMSREHSRVERPRKTGSNSGGKAHVLFTDSSMLSVPAFTDGWGIRLLGRLTAVSNFTRGWFPKRRQPLL